MGQSTQPAEIRLLLGRFFSSSNELQVFPPTKASIILQLLKASSWPGWRNSACKQSWIELFNCISMFQAGRKSERRHEGRRESERTSTEVDRNTARKHSSWICPASEGDKCRLVVIFYIWISLFSALWTVTKPNCSLTLTHFHTAEDSTHSPLTTTTTTTMHCQHNNPRESFHPRIKMSPCLRLSCQFHGCNTQTTHDSPQTTASQHLCWGEHKKTITGSLYSGKTTNRHHSELVTAVYSVNYIWLTGELLVCDNTLNLGCLGSRHRRLFHSRYRKMHELI